MDKGTVIMRNADMNKEAYLKNFPMEEEVVTDLFGKKILKIGDHIIDELKKEDITYSQAYASLQYVYDKLKYESNFLKLD